MFDCLPDGILVSDRHGRLFDANPRICEQLGYERDELLRLTLPELAANPVGLPAVGEAIVDGLLDDELDLRRKDGSVLPVEISVRSLPGGRLVFSVRDIRRRKEAEETLRRSEALLRTAMESITDGLLVVSEGKKKVTHYNRRFLELWSIPEKIAAAGDDSRLVAIVASQVEEPERFVARVAEIYRTDDKVEDTLRLKDGRIFERFSYPLFHSADREIERMWLFRDVTERRREAEALEKRLEVLTRSTDTAGQVAFEELFDLAEIQRIQDMFSQATGVASVITAPDGTPITKPSNFCRLCSEVIRKTQTGRANCYCSDAAIGRYHPEGPIIQPCLSGGLWDAGASIAVGGRHVANWLIGQVRDGTQTEEDMRRHARTIGADEDEFLAAFREVPTMPRARFERVAQALFVFANQLSQDAYRNLQQARFIAERQRAEASLQTNLQETRWLMKSMANAFVVWGMIFDEAGRAVDLRFEYFNDAYEKIVGVALDQVQGRTVSEVWPATETEWFAVYGKVATSGQPERFEMHHAPTRGLYAGVAYRPGAGPERVCAVFEEITERKHAEEALRESEKRFRQMFEHNWAVMMLMDPETGSIIEINPAAAEFYGYTREALCRMHIWDINALPVEEVKEALTHAGVRKRNDFVFPHRLASGEIRTVEVHSSPIDVGGRSLLFSIVQDITKRKRAEDAMQAFRFTIEQGGDAVLWSDRAGVIYYANEQACRSLGYTREELLRLKLSDIDPDRTPESVIDRWDNPANATPDGRRHFEARHRRKDGTLFPVEIVAKTMRFEGRDLFVAFVRDISVRKQTEETLRAQKALLADTQRIAHVGSWELDHITRQLSWSDESFRIHGFEPGSFQPTFAIFLSSVHPDDRAFIEAHLKTVENRKTYPHFECRIVRPNGQIRWIHVSGEVVCDEAGMHMRTLGPLQDITDQKEAEDTVRLANRRLRMLSDGNGALVHVVDEPGLLETVCRIVVNSGGYRMAWVGLAENDEAMTVRPVAAAGLDEGYLQAVGITWGDMERGLGPVGSAIRTGQACVVQDIRADPHFEPWRGEAVRRGYAAVCALPLAMQGRTLGALCVYSAQADVFDAPEVAALRELAGNLAFGIAALRTRAEHARAERLLRESERNYREVFDATGDAIIIHEMPGGKPIDVNETMLKMYGFDTKEEALALNPVLETPPYTAADALRHMNQAMETGLQVFEWLACRKDGTTFWTEVAMRRSDIGGRARILASVRDITARRHAEEVLHTTERKLAEIFRASPELIGLTTQEEGRFLEVNDAFTQLLGYSREETIGHSSLEIGVWPTAEDRNKLIAELKANGSVQQSETRHRKKSGEIVDVLVSMTPITVDGQACLITISADITERKKLDVALREAEALYRTMFQASPDGMTLVDLAGRVTFVSPKALEIYGGFNAQAAVGQAIIDFVAPEDRARAKADFDALVRDRVGFMSQYSMCRKDGSTFSGEISAALICDESGRPTSVLSITRDVTERKRAEAALKASEHKLAEIFRASPEFISVSTLEEGRFLEINEAYTRLLGYRRDEVIGHSALEIGLWHSPEDRRQMVAMVRDHGGLQNQESRMRKKDGEIVPVLVSMSPIVIDGQSCLITLASDISERKRAEAERLDLERRLLHAQKLESLGVLAGGIAHDFNNLLMAILGNLDLTLMDLSPVSPARASIEQCVLAARRAADLTRQMLAYSGKGRFDVRSIDLGELVEENAHLFRTCISKIVGLDLRIDRKLPAIKADAGQLQQVIMNLITNASEAIGERAGVITLTTGVQECDASYLAHSRVDDAPAPGRFVYLEVADTGCGMDANTLQRLFDPFFTTKFLGRGLGMSAILGIVRAHQGAILVDSTVGSGTTIRVLFPVGDDTPVPSEVSSVAADGSIAADSKPQGAILVVDDEDMVRSVCLRMLRQHGWRVFAAADGPEAIETYRLNAAAITCVILDLSMPQMDGMAVFRELRAIKPDVKVILSSGYSSDQGAGERFFREGLAGFIQKPYTSQSLRHELTRVLRHNG